MTPESGRTAAGAVIKSLFFIYLAVILALSVWPLKGPVGSQNDKVNHAAAFFAFVILGWLAYPRRPILLLVAGGLLYGGLIEGVQHFIPYRVCSWGDMAADVVGIVAGLAVLGLALLMLGSRRQALVRRLDHG